LEVIRRHGARQVRLIDRTFNDPPGRAVELVRMFARDFPELEFHLEIDPARLTPDFIDALRWARPGQMLLEVGVQTFREATLALLGRRGEVAAVRRGLADLAALKGIGLHVDLVAGLPGVDGADLMRDLNELIRWGPREIQVELLKVLPGTELDARKTEWGILAAEDPPYEVLRTATMTPGDLMRAQRLSRLVDWFYNVPAFQPLLRRGVMEDETTVGRLLDFLIGEGMVFHCPSLDNRYRLLNRFWSDSTPIRQALQYDWLKRGYSPQRGIAPGVPWKADVPPDAVLCEGEPVERFHRVVQARLDREYFFVYSGGEGAARSATAIYARP